MPVKNYPDQPVLFMKAPALFREDGTPVEHYRGFQPGSTVLKQGTVCREGHMPLPCDILFERDVAVPVRDGTILYVDIFRPVTREKVPVLINSSTFGKGGSYVTLDWFENVPGHPRMDVPKGRTSGLESWEGSDPGYWVQYGYAVCNVDIRGSCMSQGKAPYLGVQEAEDDYDVIEWLAARPWCSGKCGMTGNSWLAVAQWHCAAQQPPHLTCIAPWEGQSDMYRDEMFNGGIPNYPAAHLFAFGQGETEDILAAVKAYPLMDGYWKDKQPDVSRIEIPAYVVASWTSEIHTQGTLRAWRRLGSRDKWLRVHNTQEWTDQYDHANAQDLRRFFDHYLKGANNGWENTPRVRMAVLDPGGRDIVGRVEQEFPLARQRLKTLYLDAADMTLTPRLPPEGKVSYQGDDGRSVVRFSMEITRETEMVGYMNLILWVHSDQYDDMDLTVKVSKTDQAGRYLYHDAIGYRYSGPVSRHRVSLRRLDPEQSRMEEPYYTYDTVEKLTPGVPVEVQIGLWPTAMRFHPGERLEVAVCGFDPAAGMEAANKPPENSSVAERANGQEGPAGQVEFKNRGRHVIHTGGVYGSRLIVPIIPLE